MSVETISEEELKSSLDMKKLPKHIAIIMDGNGRWADRRNLPRVAGHRSGIDSVQEVVELCGELGIQVLTLYAFSAENWKRPPLEINALMKLLLNQLRLRLYFTTANSFSYSSWVKLMKQLYKARSII